MLNGIWIKFCPRKNHEQLLVNCAKSIVHLCALLNDIICYFFNVLGVKQVCHNGFGDIHGDYTGTLDFS